MIVCICGPTGVGKTKLSIMLAKKYQGIIINADACQIYKGLDIGSAKIKADEMEGIKHYLLDFLSPLEDYSVADYQKDARLIIKENLDKNIIIVGGTGLYMKALLYDYNFPSSNSIDYSNFTEEELYQKCLEINKDANIDCHNRRRMENFLKRNGEVTTSQKLLYDTFFIGLTTDRNILYDNINKRVDDMFNSGLVKEVDDLYKKYKDAKILHRAIGYKEVIKYLDGETTLDEAKEEIKKNSRHYAKRQYTWFNNQMNIKWFETNYKDFNKTYEEVIDYIEKKN